MKERIKQTISMVIACGFIITSLYFCRLEYAQGLQMSLADKVLRFHVLAQSDSEYDQQVKFMVRDAVAEYVTGLLRESDSLEETISIVKVHMEDINEVANQVLEEEGVEYRAQTMLTNMEFPEKEYSNFTFPAGEYQALRVCLGEGNGKNWWCVMYPNLCFSGSLLKTNEDEVEAFEETLTPQECEMIMDGKDYRIRFKLLEYIMKKLYN